MERNPLADFPVIVDWPVQWGDMDSFGHVNNTVYLRWFESARVAYLERLGRTVAIGADGLGPILAAVHCNYRQQLKYPDQVQIGASITRIGNSSLTVSHVIVSRRLKSIVADGESVVVFLDYHRGQSIRIPDSIREAIDRLQNAST